MKSWTVIDTTTGAIITPQLSLPDGVHPNAGDEITGFAWESTMTAQENPDQIDPMRSVFDPDSRSWKDSLVKVDSMLCARIGAEQEKVSGRNPIKVALALIKWCELIDYRSLSAAAIAGIAAPARARRWPFLTALATESRKTIAQAADLAEAELGPTVTRVAMLDAKATIAAAKVRAASTFATKLAAAVIDWPQSDQEE